MEELKLLASDDTLADVQKVMEKQLDDNHCPEPVKMALLIAAEEIFINIAHYAYDGKPGEAIVQMETTQHLFRAVFKDHGMPYNPLAKKDPDITLSAEEREIGGLGIFMVKETMDRVYYEFQNGWNIFTMEKDF